MQALNLQQTQLKYDGEIQDAHFSSLTEALSVPVHILISWFRNPREVELLIDISNSATVFDAILENYEMISIRAQALQESWNNLWISQEPFLVSAIPLIGEKMSGINSGRAYLLKKMDATVEHLQVLAKSLLRYAEINSSIAEELRMEDIHQLATDKLFLAELEQELVSRINIICTKGSIHKLSQMSDFIESLTRKLGLIEKISSEATTENPSCNSLSKAVEPDQDVDPITDGGVHCNQQMVEKDDGSKCNPQIQAGQYGAMRTSFAAEDSIDNKINLSVLNHSSSVSDEQLPMALQNGLLSSQKIPSSQDMQVGIGGKHLHYKNQNVKHTHE